MNIEQHKQKGRGQILKYISKIHTVQAKAKKINGLFFQNIVYDLDNMQQNLNRKLSQQNAPSKEQLFSVFPQKLGQERFSSTFRQTMKSRPTLLQTNKPDQSLNISL